ncbi:MAG: hypothetical protein SOI26_03920 [Coriobacteriales bacterium]|jgi:hypothetical protein
MMEGALLRTMGAAAVALGLMGAPAAGAFAAPAAGAAPQAQACAGMTLCSAGAASGSHASSAQDEDGVVRAGASSSRDDASASSDVSAGTSAGLARAKRVAQQAASEAGSDRGGSAGSDGSGSYAEAIRDDLDALAADLDKLGGDVIGAWRSGELGDAIDAIAPGLSESLGNLGSQDWDALLEDVGDGLSTGAWQGLAAPSEPSRTV